MADPGRLTLGSYIAGQWLPHVRTRVRARTAQRYAELLELHVLPVIGSLKLAKLRPAHIQSMLDRLQLAPRTKLHVYRVLSEALRHAVRVQLLASNPAAGASPRRPGRPLLTVPLAADVGGLIDAADGWLKTAVVLAASTGMRRGEILALQWRAVDLDRRTARVELAVEALGRELRFGQPKTARSRRTVSLPAGTVAYLRRLHADQAEPPAPRSGLAVNGSGGGDG
jgi:integrase